MKRMWTTVWVWVLLLALLVGCGGTTTLSKDEAANFAAEVDALSENLLTSLNAGDYEAYIRDMDPAMRKVSTREDFENLCAMLAEKIGAYQSREMSQVAEKDGLRAVIYEAQFERESGVTVRVVYSLADETPQISGLWFDSPKLRQK